MTRRAPPPPVPGVRRRLLGPDQAGDVRPVPVVVLGARCVSAGCEVVEGDDAVSQAARLADAGIDHRHRHPGAVRVGLLQTQRAIQQAKLLPERLPRTEPSNPPPLFVVRHIGPIVFGASAGVIAAVITRIVVLRCGWLRLGITRVVIARVVIARSVVARVVIARVVIARVVIARSVVARVVIARVVIARVVIARVVIARVVIARVVIARVVITRIVVARIVVTRFVVARVVV